MKFDRSWLPTIGAVIVLLVLRQNAYNLPLIARQILGFAGGIWLLWLAWQAWQLRTFNEVFSNSRNVQYWRGRKIEMAPQRTKTNLPAPKTMAITALYALAGICACLLIIGGLF